MGAVFGAADIEKLVANFPPLSISANGRPAVVRSFSKNSLKNTAEVLSYFKTLVERHDQRIQRSSLNSVLGIEENSDGVLLDTLDSQLYYSADGRYIIPHPLIENIAAVLKERALRLAVDLHAFAREQDIRYDSLERMIEEYSGRDWPRVIIDVDNTSFLCSYVYSESVKTQIHNATSDAGTDICNISTIIGPDIPAPIVAALATEIAESKGGEVKFSGEHVVYIPKGHIAPPTNQDEEVRTAQVDSLVVKLEHDGFCVLRESPAEFVNELNGDVALDDAVIAEFTKKNPNSLRPLAVDVRPEAEVVARASRLTKDTKLIARPETLRDELGLIKMAVGTRAGILWSTGPNAATPANVVRDLQHSDFDTQHKEELADLLIRSPYAKDLEATALNCLSELEAERHEQFVELVGSRLWYPLHCYAAGVMEVQDPTLRQHLEDFLTVQMKSDAVPAIVSAARDQGFLNDRSRKKETDKLQKSIEEGKILPDVQKAISRFAKKLNIPTPSESHVFTTKSRALSQTLKSMDRMQRGSDVLQNLIWVLLATSGPGLFMSSGKDTSRMIKHYDSVCDDPEVAGLLAIWRDKLKSGTEDPEDIRQMKELAKGAVEEWTEDERRRPYVGT
ncbi:hypothetical protein CKM354_000164600 [Cercospora kikuchii]|uniref:Uncharacterized protein n=1 Tax=Cercospora kikuchii TaxID=84275 RepID=A0A9P3F8W6_9PEZI|nr:uncharacterized protein CKM354_000164600 [Cercospora kikuchii]GIZ38223.1 hypothetical protein CKM354_000164600 [Cercospora kikuchii]